MLTKTYKSKANTEFVYQLLASALEVEIKSKEFSGVMKYFVVVILFAAAAVSSAETSVEQMKEAIEILKQCQEESGASSELLLNLRSGQPTDNTPELKVSIDG